MYVTKKHLSRRLVLQGGSTMLALPLLDAMIPASTAMAQTAAAPNPRMGFVFFPMGQVMSRWTPAKTGTDYQVSENLKALEPFKDKMTVVSGLRNRGGESGGPHAGKAGTWLSCALPKGTIGAVTADQIAAQQIGQSTPFDSLQLATESAVICDSGIGCGFGNTVSYRTPTQPLPIEYNPRKMFYKLFGQGDSDAERVAIASEKGSLLDAISGRATDLKRELGAGDRLSVDAYLESVRELERQLAKLEAQDRTAMVMPDAPIGVPTDIGEHINMMFDFIALAYQTNMTKVATFMLARESSMKTFPHLGVSEAFHPLSHHQNQPAKLDTLAKVQKFHTESFARFIDKLEKTPDGDGSLLDHSIILYGSNMSDSNAHNCDPLPNVVLGGGYGKIKGGQHLAFPQDTPQANLVLTLLQRAGINQESIGDSTAAISEL